MRLPPFSRPTGGVSRRLFAIRKILTMRAESARQAAKRMEAVDDRAAAALRGKAQGYREAIEILDRLDKGQRVSRSRRWERPA